MDVSQPTEVELRLIHLYNHISYSCSTPARRKRPHGQWSVGPLIALNTEGTTEVDDLVTSLIHFIHREPTLCHILIQRCELYNATIEPCQCPPETEERALSDRVALRWSHSQGDGSGLCTLT